LVPKNTPQIPFRFGEFVRRLVGTGDAGIVDQHVEPAERLDGGGNRSGYLGFLRRVAMQVDGLATLAFQRGFECVSWLVENVEDGDGCAFFAEAICNGGADAECGAGDDGDFAFEAVHD
jgi:hypothetical protein